ncbi:unnamed protein product [Meloidogyne enterolobii]|uniref:Uncharacterized protein n=1 Tax=Meloidogyne enterolobii TaxID=390850 RepID=A0ACB0ZEF9_MELEN
MCIFSPKRLPHSINLKNERKSLPPELLPEIVKFLPLNLKWSKQRVSLSFDIFLFKTQNQWISILKLLDHLKKLFTLTDKRMDALHKNIPKIGNDLGDLVHVSAQVASCLQMVGMYFYVNPGFSSSLKKVLDGWFKIKRDKDILSEMSTASSHIVKVKEIINLLEGVVNEEMFLAIKELNGGFWEECVKEMESMLVATEPFA